MRRSTIKFSAACLTTAMLAVSAARGDDEAKPMTEAQLERMHQRNKREAQSAWARDEKKMKRAEFAQMEADYQEINQKYRQPEIKEIIERFLNKYKEGNRVGCATMYLAQKSNGEEREELLETAIKDFSDAYYLNGCNVGGLARLYLASHHMRSGDKRKAAKLVAEIEKDYATAQDHSGKPIVEMARALMNEE